MFYYVIVIIRKGLRNVNSVAHFRSISSKLPGASKEQIGTPKKDPAGSTVRYHGGDLAASIPYEARGELKARSVTQAVATPTPAVATIESTHLELIEGVCQRGIRVDEATNFSQITTTRTARTPDEIDQR